MLDMVYTVQTNVDSANHHSSSILKAECNSNYLGAVTRVWHPDSLLLQSLCCWGVFPLTMIPVLVYRHFMITAARALRAASVGYERGCRQVLWLWSQKHVSGKA